MPWGDGPLPLVLAVLDPGYLIAALFLLGLGILAALQLRHGRRMDRLSGELSTLAARVGEVLEALNRSLGSPAPEHGERSMEELVRRLARIEERIEQAVCAEKAPAPPPPGPGGGIREAVEHRLAAEGFNRLRLPSDLSCLAEKGTFHVSVEAYRDGAAYKGEIVVQDGAVVELRMRPSYEAFP